MHDAIREPSQARSRKTMDEVYRSMDALLRERNFDRITIADLAAHADVAVGSIYARFKDKNALLAGLFLNVSGEAERCLVGLTDPSKYRERSDDQMLRSIILMIDRYYRQNGHVLVAATMAGVQQNEVARVRVWQDALDRFQALLVSRSPDADPAQLRIAVKIAIRFTTAAMHQSIAIASVNTWEGRVTQKLMHEELVRLSLDLVDRAKLGTLTGR